jgi:hypothetical protein
MMTKIKQLHDETERLMQQSLGANLLFVAYLLDIARMELHQHIAPGSKAAQLSRHRKIELTESAKAPVH